VELEGAILVWSSPHFEGNGGVRGWICYPVPERGIMHNLSAKSDTLSLSVYELIARQVLHRGSSPKFGIG
jgi:hypothetical protein